MAGKRKADDDVPGASQPPTTPPDDDGDSPDLTLALGLPGVGRRDTERRGEVTPPPLQLQPMGASGSDTEHRTEVEPPAPQPRPTTGRSGEQDKMTFRPWKDQASWTERGSAMGADLPRPSQRQQNFRSPQQYHMFPQGHTGLQVPPPQHFQSPQQYQIFPQGYTGLQVPSAIPGLVFPRLLSTTGNAQQPQTAPASASNQLASRGQMRQQHGRSIIPRDDAQQRSARILELEPTARRELQQQGKRQKIEQGQATMSAAQWKPSLPPGAAAQAQEQATVSARREKLRLGQHAPAAQVPVPVGQSVAESRGLAVAQPELRLVRECPACRVMPAAMVFDPVRHSCLCARCFRDPSNANACLFCRRR